MRTFWRGLLALPIGAVLAFGGAVTAHADVQSGSTPDPQAVKRAEALLESCLKKTGVSFHGLLKDKQQQQKFLDCAVPPKKQDAFKKCVKDVVLNDPLKPRKWKDGVIGCVDKHVFKTK